MLRNLRKGRDRCLLCGVRTTLHFTPDNRKLTCQQATETHPRASVRAVGFSALLRMAVGR